MRSPNRKARRNGYRERMWEMRVVTIPLEQAWEIQTVEDAYRAYLRGRSSRGSSTEAAPG